MATRWITLYDLHEERGQRANLEEASAGPPPFGIVPEPAPAGSDEWFSAIERGELPSGVDEGVVERVWWGSMVDWPEFDLVDERGDSTTWTRYGDPRRYVPGLKVRVRWVEVRHKPGSHIADPHRMVLRIDLEDSDKRVSGIAPGPGRAGYRMLGGAGTVVHFLACRSLEDSAALRRSLGLEVPLTDHELPSGEVLMRLAERSPEEVRVAAERIGAWYDGYEILRDGDVPEVFGPNEV